jgi:hypothetical protein
MTVDFKSKFLVNGIKYNWITAEFCIWTCFIKKLYKDLDKFRGNSPSLLGLFLFLE